METYDGEAEEKCPKTSHRMQLDCLPNSHLMLAILAIVGIAQEVLVDQNLGVLDVFLVEAMTVDRIELCGSMLLDVACVKLFIEYARRHLRVTIFLLLMPR
jgi:hypothetical protein